MSHLLQVVRDQLPRMKGLPARCAFLTAELVRAHDGAAVVMKGLLARLELEPRDQGLVKFERHPGALHLREPFVGVMRTSQAEGTAAAHGRCP